jgi:hypothetical protein
VRCAVQNEMNNVIGALRVSTRSASGHSGCLERRDSCDGSRALSCSSHLSAFSVGLESPRDRAASSGAQPQSLLPDEDRLEPEGAAFDATGRDLVYVNLFVANLHAH